MDIQMVEPKPISYEAMQWDGTVEQAEKLIEWFCSTLSEKEIEDLEPLYSGYRQSNGRYIYALTLSSRLSRLRDGGWLLRNTETGEFYAESGKYFDEIYRPVEVNNA